jgi:nicotinamidase-related amidase
MRNTALMIIDMQQNYMRSIEPSKLDDLVAQQLALLDLCRQRDVPIFTIRMDVDIPIDTRIAAAAMRAPRHEPYLKKRRDAFTNPRLERAVERHGIRHLIISGIYASNCVLATAATARRKYKIWTTPALIADSEAPEFVSTQGDVHEAMSENAAMVQEWYHLNTNYHPDVTSLLRALDDNI